MKARFNSRVTRGPGCWTHSGSLGSRGYPQATGPDGRSHPAHRIAWLLAKGPVPVGAMVLHRCNNKHCVRPGHLYAGTHRDNMDDLARVGHPRRKLTNRQARAIRSDQRVQRVIAAHYGVDQVTVQRIKNGQTYRYA